MAKIVYGVSGEGSGHSSRSSVIINHLMKNGHTVKVASYNRGYQNLKDKFDVLKIEGLKFVIEDNKISAHKTIGENLATILKRYESSIVLKKKLFKEFQPDCVITDFEPMTAYFANQYAIPLITIDNQHRIRYQHLDLPGEMIPDAIIAENFIRLMIPRPDVSLITTFYYSKLKNDRSFLFPPILDEEIFKLKPKFEDYVLVYVTGNFDSLFEILKTYKREKFIIFGYNKNKQIENLYFKKVSRGEFLQYLANSKAVMATAGFTLITEALYLNKPYLAFPLKSQFEQQLNAYLIEKSGYGYMAKEVNKRIISAFLYDLYELTNNLNNYQREDNGKIFDMLDRLLENDLKLVKEYNEKRKTVFAVM